MKKAYPITHKYGTFRNCGSFSVSSANLIRVIVQFGNLRINLMLDDLGNRKHCKWVLGLSVKMLGVGFHH